MLTPEQLARDLAVRDLTDPATGSHAVQLILNDLVDTLARLWGCEVRWCRSDRVVSIADNYDNLGYDSAAVTRDARYTRYVDANRMLRSHSSAMVPAALRALAADPVDDVLVVCPGIVYRRDSIDRLHTGTPHQLDLWRISRKPLGPLEDMIVAVVGGAEHRVEPRVHPYTVDGLQVDLRHGGEWVEIGECGLAHPEVLARAGLDASWSGLAMGLGLDRILMLRKGIPDIRILRSDDPQLLDLLPYRPVSAMPSITRDLSVAVEDDDLVEDLGDRVRDAVGDDCVESVEIVSETPCAELPPRARERLGAREDQKNLLVRIVLRRLDRTLSDAEANELRDRVYAAVHRGSAHQWALGRRS
ncbi:hypothetical protein GCM10022247_55250 [Allokutzneria multivorans]|uniref:Phenylalanyl-tRNA synthetase n=1 Tax=Allokutzneria multivorans TaxID=1142134 RepID=A0ABP7TBB7_9PSEU